MHFLAFLKSKLFSKIANTILTFISLLWCAYLCVFVGKRQPWTKQQNTSYNNSSYSVTSDINPLKVKQQQGDNKIYNFYNLKSRWVVHQLVVAIFPPGPEGSTSSPQFFKDAAVFGGRAQYELMSCAGMCVCVCAAVNMWKEETN